MQSNVEFGHQLKLPSAGLHVKHAEQREIWVPTEVTIGRVACEACRATWKLGTNSAFALGRWKTTETLDRVGRSQDISDVN
jgi:hypothetical protein